MRSVCDNFSALVKRYFGKIISMAFFQVYDAKIRSKEEMINFLEEKRNTKEKGLAKILVDYHFTSQLRIQHQQSKASRACER